MRVQSLQKRAKKTTRNRKNGKINRKKRFGKSIANHAPARFLTIIDRELGCQGLSIRKIDTYDTKASQVNHVTVCHHIVEPHRFSGGSCQLQFSIVSSFGGSPWIFKMRTVLGCI